MDLYFDWTCHWYICLVTVQGRTLKIGFAQASPLILLGVRYFLVLMKILATDSPKSNLKAPLVDSSFSTLLKAGSKDASWQSFHGGCVLFTALGLTRYWRTLSTFHMIVDRSIGSGMGKSKTKQRSGYHGHPTVCDLFNKLFARQYTRGQQSRNLD